MFGRINGLLVNGLFVDWKLPALVGDDFPFHRRIVSFYPDYTFCTKPKNYIYSYKKGSSYKKLKM